MGSCKRAVTVVTHTALVFWKILSLKRKKVVMLITHTCVLQSHVISQNTLTFNTLTKCSG